jgi:hypothetical protein
MTYQGQIKVEKISNAMEYQIHNALLLIASSELNYSWTPVKIKDFTLAD